MANISNDERNMIGLPVEGGEEEEEEEVEEEHTHNEAVGPEAFHSSFDDD